MKCLGLKKSKGRFVPGGDLELPSREKYEVMCQKAEQKKATAAMKKRSKAGGNPEITGAAENEAMGDLKGSKATGGNPEITGAAGNEAMGDLKGSKATGGNPEIAENDQSGKRVATSELGGKEEVQTALPPGLQVRGGTSTKKVWMVTDPLEFPPSKYHKNLFRCNQPLVTLADGLPSNDQFGGLQMQQDVREKAMKFLLRPCIEIFRSHEICGEMSGCMLHASLFQNIWMITKPSKRLMKSIDTMEKEYEVQYKAKKRQKLENPIPGDDNEDFLVDEIEAPAELDEEAQPLNTDSFRSDRSNESLVMGGEATPDDGEETGQGRMDIRFSVYNTSNMKWKKKFRRRNKIDSRKSVCVVECKWDNEDANGIYQAACYACQEALKNISNLHFEPIYVLVLSKSKWTYGILDPRGKINVKDGEIDISSFQEFSEQEGIRFSADLTSLEELKAQLRESTTFYRQHYSSCPDAVYPTKQFVVGTLHMSEEWYALPDFMCVNGATRYGVHLFYEGLLRIIIGEKVTQWNIEDFKKAKEIKKGVRNQNELLMFGSPDL